MQHTKPILEHFMSRHTVRDYKPEPLATGDLDRIIKAGQRAPTGGLAQIYSVVRVTDTDLRGRLSSLCGNQQHIRDAAEFFVFCLDVHRTQRLIEHQGGVYGAGPGVTIHYGTMDVLLVAANMVTVAEVLGYGTCYIGAVLNNLDAVAHELQLPKGVMPVVGLTIGVPDVKQALPRKPRLPSRLIFHENSYHEPAPDDLDSAYQTMGDPWFASLKRYFGPKGVFARREKVWERTLVQQGFRPTQGEETND